MTLTETVFWSKIFSKIFVGMIGAVIIGYYGYLYIQAIRRTPDDIFKPSYKCGQLPEITIEGQEGASYGQAQIYVEALRTSIKDVPRITYVYKISNEGETFQTRDSAKYLAGHMGFEKDNFTRVPGSTVYTWRSDINKSTLRVDTSTLNFTFLKDDSQLPSAPNLQLPATLYRAPEYAKNYLSSLGRFTADYAGQKPQSYPVIMRNQKPYVAQSIDDAQLIRVDFQKEDPLLVYQKSILSLTGFSGAVAFETWYDKAAAGLTPDPQYQIFKARRVGKTPNISNVQVYMRNISGDPANGLQQVIFNDWKVVEKPCGTYPIIQPADVITEISKGAGTIVSLRENTGDPLQPQQTQPLREIRLYQLEIAYYETPTLQPYLQPIYVATGEVTFENGAKGEIAVYVAAINYAAHP